MERKIEIFDPVYAFCEVIDHIDLKKYLTEKDSRLGRKRYDEITLLKVIPFAYMEEGYISTRRIEKLCKTDPDATFMQIKRDYMKNDQLLPGFNMQMGICDEYVAVFDIKQYASDTDCFVPLVERFVQLYGFYPRYPVADAGYGSFNNYLYCQEHGLEKYMKFSMYEDEEGCLLCPGNKRFHFVKNVPIKNNRFGRTEEYYQCENCEGCEQRENCFRGNGNRIVRLNRELTQIHQEILNNLNSIHGALLRMNRSIQAEGVFGSIKWNRSYTRARRRGLKGLKLEIGLISCGFNLHKYHLKSLAKEKAA